MTRGEGMGKGCWSADGSAGIVALLDREAPPPLGGGEVTVAPTAVCICIGIASAREEVLPILNNQLAKVSPSLFGLATCEKISSFCM